MGTEIAIAGFLATALNTRLKKLLSDPSVQGKNTERIKKLQGALEKIHEIALLDRMKQISGQSFKDWIWRFKDTFYLANDAVDGLEYQVAKYSEKQDGGRSSSSSSSRSSLVTRALHNVLPGASPREFDKDDIKQLVQATENLDELIKDISDVIRVAKHLVGGTQMVGNSWRRGSHLSLREIIGRDDDLKNLLTKLVDSRFNKFAAVSIVGPAGIGKTELARLAYNHAEVNEHFQKKAWVDVGNKIDSMTLMREIINSASTNNDLKNVLHSVINLNKIRELLEEEMKDKRFLLVLDDVWEEFIHLLWPDVSILFNLGKEGSRIIVTTQLEIVAKVIESEVIQLDGLERKYHLQLLKNCALGEQKDESCSKFIDQEIADRFGGSPLAAVRIGSNFKAAGVRVDQWRKIARKKLGADQSEGDIVSVLEFSYQQLPAQLKLCFLACALFPKNHCFEENELLLIWKALGFAPGDEDNNLVEDLSSRSFFVHSKREKKEFEIHAVLHELADIISDGKFFRLEGTIEEIENLIPERARHVYVTTDNFNKVYDSLRQKENLISLVIAGSLSDDQMNTLKVVLKGLKRLRLLVIPQFEGNVPDWICDLRHLRYLDFPIAQNEPKKKLPKSFETLHYLEGLTPKAGNAEIGWKKLEYNDDSMPPKLRRRNVQKETSGAPRHN